MNERDKELAIEAGFHGRREWPPMYKEFADLIRADERGACAVLAEKTICDTHIPTGIHIYGTRAAKAIRARSGEQK